MNKITAYFAAAFRGPLGDAASKEEITENINRAVRTANSYRTHFPEVDIYVPHQNQEIILGMWEKGYVYSEDIIRVCCEVASGMDIIIALEPVTEGMGSEIEYAVCYPPKEVVYIRGAGDEDKEAVAKAIWKIKSLKDTPAESAQNTQDGQ